MRSPRASIASHSFSSRQSQTARRFPLHATRAGWSVMTVHSAGMDSENAAASRGATWGSARKTQR